MHDMLESNFSADQISAPPQRSLVPRHGISADWWETERLDQRNAAWGLVTALGLSALCWIAILKLACMFIT